MHLEEEKRPIIFDIPATLPKMELPIVNFIKIEIFEGI
jgi:hypothetical protein